MKMTRLIEPSLIHGNNFKPDINGQPKHSLVYTKTNEDSFSVKLGSNTYENMSKPELINIAAIVGWDIDFVEITLDLLNISGVWPMTLTDKQKNHVGKYLKTIHEDFMTVNDNPKKGFG